jgi:methylenetetrahydrofolate dehydrogenase (NADP+)/methenyltetrahydrofolate cyclohydrolase
MGEPRLLSGAPIAQRIRDEVAREVEVLAARRVHPQLAFVYPAGDEGARSYAVSQRRACEAVGIAYTERPLAENAGQPGLLAAVRSLTEDPAVTGILLHAPLPPSMDAEAAYRAAGPAYDVEGLHPETYGRMAAGRGTIVPCTAAAILELLRGYALPLTGKDLVIVGRSPSVGRALALLALRDKTGPTVTICHSGTPDLAAHTRRADVVVVAAGRPGLLTGEMVREGAVVVDVGTNPVRKPDGTTGVVGDADFASVAPKCAAISPVPGGVGPVTSALLLRNVVASAKLQFPA